MLNIKSIKIFKIIASSVSIASITTLGLATISCGNHQNPAKKHTWDDFKKSANAETAMKIVEATKPVGWEDASEAKLSISNRNSDDTNHDVTLDITYDAKSEKASFKIEYKDNEVYDYKNWTCTHQPVNGWNVFKALALKVTPEQLIAQARNTKVIDKFSWTYGTDEQRKWQASDKAEFDTTRGTIKSSPNPFKGMKGQATVDEQKHTITAIISKSGTSIPDYAADPIKSVITYTKTGQTYNMKDWVFTIAHQLQAKDKAYNSGIVYAIDKAPKINTTAGLEAFEKSNWITKPNGNKAANTASNHHDPTNNMKSVLEANGYKNVHNWVCVSWNYFNGNIKNGAKQVGIFAELVLSFQASNGSFEMFLKFNYMYANGNNNSGGGNPFANVWYINNIFKH